MKQILGFTTLKKEADVFSLINDKYFVAIGDLRKKIFLLRLNEPLIKIFSFQMGRIADFSALGGLNHSYRDP